MGENLRFVSQWTRENLAVGARRERLRRALEVGRVARRTRLLRVLREVGVSGERPATREAAREFRLALEELGTTYVKLGQLLSSRPDLLPDVYIEELTHLVDEVPPVPFAEIEPVIRRAIGLTAFAEIDPEPVAAASTAQIHKALMTDGREGVGKVPAAGVYEQALVDLELSALRRTSSRSDPARPDPQLSALAEEVDVHLRRSWTSRRRPKKHRARRPLPHGHPNVRHSVVHPYVTDGGARSENIEGKRVADDHGLDEERAGHLAREFFRAYVRQVAAEGVYHATASGNVRLRRTGRLALRDRLLGRLDDDTADERADPAGDRRRTAATTWRLIFAFRTRLSNGRAGLRRRAPRKLPRGTTGAAVRLRAGEALADLQRMSVKYAIRLPRALRWSERRSPRRTRSRARSTPDALDPGRSAEGDASS